MVPSGRQVYHATNWQRTARIRSPQRAPLPAVVGGSGTAALPGSHTAAAAANRFKDSNPLLYATWAAVAAAARFVHPTRASKDKRHRAKKAGAKPNEGGAGHVSPGARLSGAAGR